jgi:ferredoxin, 2Fe-2S
VARIQFIASDGGVAFIDAEAGRSLMENAVSNGIEAIKALCGGNAYCGTCRVYVDPAWRAVTGEPGEIELPMIEATDDTTPGVRLACQITVTPLLDGLIVRTPLSQEA